MVNPSVSIICPVYKAEPYIHRCIDSIIAQTFHDWELILVDDGSPDNSGRICDEYSYMDSRISVIHKQNEGVASARQLGLEKACGEYVIHCDSDDWIESTMLEDLYENAVNTDADMVLCDYYFEREFYSTVITQKPTNIDDNSQIIKDLFHNLLGVCWNKLVRRSLFERFRISFVPGVNYCEDKLVIVKLLFQPISVSYVNKAYYHYDQFSNVSSLTRKVTKQTINQECLFVDELNKLFPQSAVEIRSAKEMVKKDAFLSRCLSNYEMQSLYAEIRTLHDENIVLKMIFYIAFKYNQSIARRLLDCYSYIVKKIK